MTYVPPTPQTTQGADLLPQTTTSFEMATVVHIIDFITAEEREAVLNRHFYLFYPTLAANNTAEPANRLTLTATKAQILRGLPYPVCRFNSIAADSELSAICCADITLLNNPIKHRLHHQTTERVSLTHHISPNTQNSLSKGE